MKTEAIRRCFLDFFQQQKHSVVPSASLVPHNDPSLLFTTAGMVPFKDFFTGQENPPFQSVASCQKCVRAGGKHNDLEQVGYTPRHHTFFEMLGNFSFGSYFKEQAIFYAWTFLTQELGLPREKLWVTVYHEDTEAVTYWQKIANLSKDRIIPIKTSDNFWSMGDTGPCGPCTEIFYDHGSSLPGGLPGTPDADGDRYVEIWNLVFMAFESLADGQRAVLPRGCIDTGMGLERISAVMQGVHDNFQIDIFKSLIEASESFATSPNKTSHRVIADHIRSISFLMADGVLPSNEGRGYVLRRILRRALRHVHYVGGDFSCHLVNLLDTLIQNMGETYPELVAARSLIASVLSQEGLKFHDLLDRGLHLLQKWTHHLKEKDTLDAEKAFLLYDTYGFPLDLTQDILREKGLYVDEKGFYSYMNQQKKQSRLSWVGSGEKADLDEKSLYQELPETVFVGYERLETQGVLSFLSHEGQAIPLLNSDFSSGCLVADSTPFYAESGGQISDIGQISGPSGCFIVQSVHKINGVIVHKGVVSQGQFKVGDPITLKVDQKFRERVAANHSATHLLHAALRQVLGDHVTQKGSLVTHEKLRFDFSHFSPLTSQQLKAVEDWVLDKITTNKPVHSSWMPLEKARHQGILALFGEKYGENVRVISMGGDEKEKEGKFQETVESNIQSLDPFVSRELCGGTHVNHTGQLGGFKILSEEGVASGIRRIEAVTGMAALEVFRTCHHQVTLLSQLLKVPSDHIVSRVEDLLAENKKYSLKKAPGFQTKNNNASDLSKQWVAGLYRVCSLILDSNSGDYTGKDLKALADQLKQKVKTGIVVVAHGKDQKVTVVVGVTHDLALTLKAPQILANILPDIGGNQGGGRDDLAQGGGNDPDGMEKMLETLKIYLSEDLK